MCKAAKEASTNTKKVGAQMSVFDGIDPNQLMAMLQHMKGTR